MKDEFRVDRILKKLKTLEGIVKENVLKQDELKWARAYDKYSLFERKETPPFDQTQEHSTR